MRLTGNGVLNDQEVRKVIGGSLAILQKTGVQVENEAILRKLAGAGACIDWEKNVCRFSEETMSDFLAESERHTWAEEITFSGSAEIFQGWYLDPEDGKAKPWTEHRLKEYARLAKAMPNLDGVSMLGMPSEGWDVRLQPLTEKVFCWKWGIDGGNAIWDTALCPRIHKLWNTYADGTGQDARSLFNGTVYMISPLKFASVEAGQYAWFADRGWEVHVGSLGSLGGTTPVTPAGALAVQIAEGFFQNFLRRAYFGHMDIRLGNSISAMDMITGCFQYGRPEQTLLNIAGAQAARFLGARYGGHGGLADAKEPGYEAAMQKTASAIYNAQSGGHGHIVCGLLAVDELFSPEQLVLDAEALSWLQRLGRGFEVNEETLAVDVVDNVGWGGQYLSQDHTAEHFKDSLWMPEIFSRESLGLWNNSHARSEREAARDRVRKILKNAPLLEPQISEKLEEQLWNVINRSK
jgi:trimethylamine---corrinoid protein Co-methyltransferase